ncbi:hypothetical protein LCGC14_0674300 [marine sediment metagenome]|uniref:Uncharacterized protein n=1 Tax=marine sediment metagenome TaxID=412755 RepID=A0A0F9TY50_9ZZZZ
MNAEAQRVICESLNSMFDHPDDHVADDVQIIDMFTAMIEKATRGLRADREMLMIREALGVIDPEKDFDVDLMVPIIACMRRDSIVYQELLECIHRSGPRPEPKPEPEPPTDAQRELGCALAELSAMGPPDSLDKRCAVLWRIRKAWMALGHG